MRHRIQAMVLGMIVLLGAGLVSTVVLSARQAAARTRCLSNLHQLGMDSRCCRMDFGAFPGPYPSRPDIPHEKRLSWLVSLMPYIEASNLMFDGSAAWDAPSNLQPLFAPNEKPEPGKPPRGPYRLERVPTMRLVLQGLRT